MKLSFDTGHKFRPAMETVQAMGLGNGIEADTPACRLVLKPGSKHVRVLALRPDHALRLDVPLGDGEAEPGETVLPAGAVRALCAAPLRAPLTIEAEGLTILATAGRRPETFEAPESGHEERTIEGIVNSDTHETGAQLAADAAAEHLRSIDGGAGTFRISVGADGVRASKGDDERVDRNALAVLSDTPAEGPPAVFSVRDRLMDNALRALRGETVTLRVGQGRSDTIAIECAGRRIVLAPARLG